MAMKKALKNKKLKKPQEARRWEDFLSAIGSNSLEGF